MIRWEKVLLLFLGFSAVGWFCMIYGVLRQRWFRRKLERETEEAEGRILRYTAKTVSAGQYRTRKAYFPVLSFRVGGTDVEVQSKDELKPEEYPEGSKVTLWFDPFEPSHLHLTTDDNGIGAGVIRLSWFLILGAAVLSLIIGPLGFRG